MVVAGWAANIAPVPTMVPKPQPPSYHLQSAPVESAPVTDNVVVWPVTIVEGLATADVGLLRVIMITVTLTQVEFPHAPNEPHLPQ